MSLDNIIVLLLGSSIFAMGICLGAIIEFNRSKKYFGNLIYERDKEYTDNIIALIAMMHQIEGRLKIVQKESKYNLQEIRKVSDLYEESFSPEVTQEVDEGILSSRDRRDMCTCTTDLSHACVQRHLRLHRRCIDQSPPTRLCVLHLQ